ncbi:M48 family metallopeptidase [Candidatus Saccharibacteria bacterium]|nr:M48 family metallopeptidase [Candidatus Saccharibacteria bacterium]MBI3337828.1 M48 family metallopeptidase [Candidatus Saccharibacteria bacterium]
MTTRTFEYGTHSYIYGLVRQDRKTLSLTVEPCLDIILKVPEDVDNERIEKFLRKKWMWLNKQLTFFEKYRKKYYQKEYVSGESFYYLGRQYKLIVVNGDKNSVALSKGKLTITTGKNTSDGKYNRTLLERWYKQRRHAVFTERYAEVLTHFDYKFTPELTVRVMARRWGSYIKGERIILNPLLIQAPKEAIDYVITHELCHMKYKNHDPRFFQLMDTKYTGWRKTKEKLELLVA